MTCLVSYVESLCDGQHGTVQLISFLKEKFEDMKTSCQEKTGERQQQATAENDRLQRQVEDLTRQVTDLDQYHRRVNLEFAGVPEEEGEDPDKLVLQIARKIHPGISADDIDVAHRLGKATCSSDGNRGPHPIIARFPNRCLRNKINDRRRKLQNVTI